MRWRPACRLFSYFTFPVEQVQTVYRLLARAEPSALERLCMAITVGGIDDRYSVHCAVRGYGKQSVQKYMYAKL